MIASISHLTVSAAVFLTLATLPAQAASFCDDLGMLAQLGDTGASLRLPQETSGQLASCRTSLTLNGGKAMHCYWAFPYRSDAAKDVFVSVIAEVSECLGPDAIQSRDQRVNHPDAYDLRLFEVGGQEFAVSLKDKGALQQTLIFVRVPLSAPH
jgi:hypothetical protein